MGDKLIVSMLVETGAMPEATIAEIQTRNARTEAAARGLTVNTMEQLYLGGIEDAMHSNDPHVVEAVPTAGNVLNPELYDLVVHRASTTS